MAKQLFVLDGPPVPWAAPRICRTKTFDVKSNEKIAITWSLIAQRQLTMKEALNGPVGAIITFVMPIPKSFSKKRKLEMETHETYHVCKPDTGNMEKLLLDCVEKAEIVHNDSQICEIHAKKIYGKDPKTILTLEELNERTT